MERKTEPDYGRFRNDFKTVTGLRKMAETNEPLSTREETIWRESFNEIQHPCQTLQLPLGTLGTGSMY